METVERSTISKICPSRRGDDERFPGLLRYMMSPQPGLLLVTGQERTNPKGSTNGWMKLLGQVNPCA